MTSEIVYTYTDFDGKLVNVFKSIKNGITTIKQKLAPKAKKIEKTENPKSFKKGMIVQPNHKGQDMQGRIIDWSVYKGAIKTEPYFNHDGRDKQLIVDVIWFGEAHGMPRNYPVTDLDWTGRYWEKMR